MVFVLVGLPLGIMARRGGFGIAATLSLGFFVLYWAFLIGGEKLADRDILSPFLGMWAANIIIGIMGIYLTFRIGRETVVIDWSFFQRFIPRRMRSTLPDEPPTRRHGLMKLFDRYIIRQFLSTALFSLLAVLVIFIVIDAMEKLDDFIDKQAGLGYDPPVLCLLHSGNHQTDHPRGDAPRKPVRDRPAFHPERMDRS